MKANNPATIALVLWLLFCAADSFAALKSPYPRKTAPPDKIVVINKGSVDLSASTTTKPK
jgi:uncharacterized membrane protein YcaP (DUF421 family)